jgi:hypothetical protein
VSQQTGARVHAGCRGDEEGKSRSSSPPAGPRSPTSRQACRPTAPGASRGCAAKRFDILATNRLGRALFSELYAAPTRPANFARFWFLDREPKRSTRLGRGRAKHRRDPARSRRTRPKRPRTVRPRRRARYQERAFRTHWAVHNVRFHATAIKLFNHPVVGELSLSFNRMDITADHGLTPFTHAA